MWEENEFMSQVFDLGNYSAEFSKIVEHLV